MPSDPTAASANVSANDSASAPARAAPSVNPAANASSAPLHIETIAALLPPEARRWFDLRVAESTGSTNADLLRDCAHLPSGTVLAAEHQTAGRGRRGRAWIAPPGANLTFSVLWKFRSHAAALSGLSLAVGVAVARAITRCGAAGVALKWPNDVLARRGEDWAKLGGILIELKTGADAAPETGDVSGSTSAVIGIGINVDLGAAALPVGQPATDLRALGCDVTRNALLAALLEQLGAVLPQFALHGFAPLAPEWNQLHAWRGQAVQLTDDVTTIATAALSAPAALTAAVAGIAQGAADDGALLIDTPAGQRRVVSGDVSLRLAPR